MLLLDNRTIPQVKQCLFPAFRTMTTLEEVVASTALNLYNPWDQVRDKCPYSTAKMVLSPWRYRSILPLFIKHGYGLTILS